MGETTFTKILPCVLGEEEVLQRGREAATLMAEKDEADEALAKAKRAHKASTETLEGRIRRLMREVRTRTTDRDVECVQRENWDETPPLMESIRLDTGETIGQRPLTESERQLHLTPGAVAGGETTEGVCGAEYESDGEPWECARPEDHPGPCSNVADTPDDEPASAEPEGAPADDPPVRPDAENEDEPQP